MDCIVEQHEILGHIANALTPGLDINRFDCLAANKNLTLLCRVQTYKQINERGLSGTGWPLQHSDLVCRHIKGGI